MKSTYKLIGSFLDGVPARERHMSLEAYDLSFMSLDVQSCLFDLGERKRKVSLASLLSLEDQPAFDEVLTKLKEADQIAIVLDCYPQSSNLIVWKFFQKRILQIVHLIEEAVPAASLKLMHEFGQENTCSQVFQI